MTAAGSDPRAKLRVLIIEDEALLRWSVAEALRASGHTVLEASDRAGAVQVLASADGTLDAVLLDLRLPDSNDLSLLADIRRRTPATAVVMMTAHGTREDAAHAKALGAYDMLEKPFDIQRIEPILVAARGARPAPRPHRTS
jgi:DNA-binding NtrC family response regulator